MAYTARDVASNIKCKKISLKHLTLDDEERYMAESILTLKLRKFLKLKLGTDFNYDVKKEDYNEDELDKMTLYFNENGNIIKDDSSSSGSNYSDSSTSDNIKAYLEDANEFNLLGRKLLKKFYFFSSYS